SLAKNTLQYPKLNFTSNVYVCFPDGRVKNLTPMSGIFYQSCINLDGTHVVFSGNSAGVLKVWRTDVETGETIALTNDGYAARHPVFSSAGDEIAYSADQFSGQEPEKIEQLTKSGLPPEEHIDHIFVMDTNGRNKRQITHGLYQDQRPCFSPDGKTIAFISNRGASFFGLWSVPSDGSDEPKLIAEIRGADSYTAPISAPAKTNELRNIIYRPWYSVDGKTIYVFSDIAGRHQICSILATGGVITPLANDDAGRSHGPYADPNGKTLLMHSTRDGDYTIWELPLGGGSPRRLQPPGIDGATHATRSRSGIIAFDVVH
ncbi:MAG: PD40 domain-containing protein, partial [Leptospiraceae bacterium]|nr:PD40 domain-containing protein [Leptospiraceae bacterium]